MKSPKVRLLVRIRRSGERYAYVDPAWNRNRTLREGYAVVDGKQEHHPEGIYYLRYKRGANRVRDAVGQRADLALVPSPTYTRLGWTGCSKKKPRSRCWRPCNRFDRMRSGCRDGQPS